VNKKGKSSEWRRGYRWQKQYFSKFRSFKRLPDGTYVGYKKGGGTEVIGSLAQHKGTKGFGAGAYTAMKEEIKARPTRTVKRRASGMGLYSSPRRTSQTGGIFGQYLNF
jgi:hypothetical protein